MFRKQDFKKIDLLGSGKITIKRSNTVYRKEEYKDL